MNFEKRLFIFVSVLQSVLGSLALLGLYHPSDRVLAMTAFFAASYAMNAFSREP